jgi:tetratricopeptide (TPR) repeat protein
LNSPSANPHEIEFSPSARRRKKPKTTGPNRKIRKIFSQIRKFAYILSKTAMDSLTLAILIIGVVVLLAQASSCFLKANRSIPIGVVDLILAALVAATTLAVQSGHMLLAKDFGTVMVQGPAGVWFLRIALVTVALLPSLCLARLLDFKKNLPNWFGLAWLPGTLGTLVGLVAAGRVSLLDRDLSPALQVFQYDVWWAPLVLWLTVCLTGSILVLADADLARWWLPFTAAWVTVLASFAVSYEDLADPSSRPIWSLVWNLSFPVCLWFVAYELWKSGLPEKRLPGILKPIAVACLACMAAWFALAGDSVRYVLGSFPLVVFFLVVAIAIVRDDPKSDSLLPKWNVAGIAIGFALPLVALAVADLFSAGFFPSALDIFVALLAWLLFAERVAEHALNQLPRLFVNNQLQIEPVRKFFGASRKAAGSAASGVKKVLDYAVSGTWVTLVAKAVLLPLVVLMGVAGLSEVFNYRKIVVGSFTWIGDKDQKAGVAVADSIAPGVINALGRLRDALREDIVIASRGKTTDHAESVRLLSAGTDSSLSSSVAQSGDLELGGVKVPLAFLATPVQLLVRKLLHIKVIDGTVRQVSPGLYTVTFNSNYGKSWVESARAPAPDSASPAEPDPAAEKAPPAKEDKSTTAKTNAPAKPVKGSKTTTPKRAANKAPTAPPKETPAESETRCSPAEPAKDPLAKGIETIAFDIAAGEPTFLALGLSQDADAFSCFRAGLESWNKFIAGESPPDLDAASKLFQAATTKDHGFALAYYRLGLCLQRDGKPGAAVDEFRASYKANPDFIPAASWAARTLYYFDSDYLPDPAVLPAQGTKSQDSANRHQPLEAMQIWTRLAELTEAGGSVSELQRTYYGFCLYERDALTKAYVANGTPEQDRVYFLPYFYCRKAEALFRRMPPRDRTDREEKSLQATILNDTGATLDFHRQRSFPLPQSRVPAGSATPRAPAEEAELLPCEIDSYKLDSYKPPDALPNPPDLPLYAFRGRTKQALAYYRRSLLAVPDDPVVQCNAAMAETVVTGDARAVRALENDAGVRYAMGNDLENEARSAEPAKASMLFEMALEEYHRSLQLDSASVLALNGYAYAVWEWYLSYRNSDVGREPDWEFALRAERYSREATRLAYERRNNELKSMTLDTLGEVLLAEGRNTEAIMDLREAVALFPYFPSDHEARWDLAAADFCAADASTGADQTAHFTDAYRDLAQLSQEERTGQAQLKEWHPFHVDVRAPRSLRVHDATDVLRRVACRKNDEVGGFDGWSFDMQVPRYAPGKGCGLTTVTAAVDATEVARLEDRNQDKNDPIESPIYLHVWGGNTNERVPLIEGVQRSIQLDAADTELSSYYYAALEAGSGRILAPARSFVVYPSADQQCGKNSVSLAFKLEAPRVGKVLVPGSRTSKSPKPK